MVRVGQIWRLFKQKLQGKKSRSEGGSEGESKLRQSVKKKKSITNESSIEEVKEEWIVIITRSNDKEHFHPVQGTKAIEKEIGKITFTKLLNNRRILISHFRK